MKLLLTILITLTVTASQTSACNQVTAADGNVQCVQYLEYFEKDGSGLPGSTSYLLIGDQERFQQIFQHQIIWNLGYATSEAGAGITDTTFDSHIVLAVLKRENRVTTFYDVQTRRRGETLVVSFKSQTSPPQQFHFRSRLVLSVPREKLTRVEFVEDGKVVATQPIPALPEQTPKPKRNGNPVNNLQPPALPELPDDVPPDTH